MATTKTLTATNQTITIPEFTERPDARQYSDGESKLADAVNSNTSNINTTYRDAAASGGTISDCNNAVIGLWYYVYVSAVNIPVSEKGILFTYGQQNGTKYQIYSTKDKLFTRSYENSTWGTWNQFALDSKLTTTSFSVTRNEQNTTRGSFIGRKSGNCCVVSIDCDTNANVGWITIGTSSEKPNASTYGTVGSPGGNMAILAIGADGNIQIFTPTATNYIGQITFCV